MRQSPRALFIEVDGMLGLATRRDVPHEALSNAL